MKKFIAVLCVLILVVLSALGAVRYRNLAITSSTVDATTIGATTPSTGVFTSLGLSSETVAAVPHFYLTCFTTALTATGNVCRGYSNKALTVETLSWQQGPLFGAGSCTTAPQFVAMYNPGSPVRSSATTITNGNGFGDTTGVAFSVPAGTAWGIEVTVAASGCSTAWQNTTLTATVKEQ